MKDDLAERIVDQLDTEPPVNESPHPKLFADLEDSRKGDALLKLWQKGILDAEYRDGHTHWHLNEFGVELTESGLFRDYVIALENEIEIDAAPDTLVDLEP